METEAEGTLPAAGMAGLLRALACLPENLSDAGLVDRIRLLEEIKSAASAGQARASAALKQSVVGAEARQGIPADQRGKGVASQVALARRESPHKGSRFLGLAQALVAELPRTMEALSRGLISEWKATVVCQETACLSVAHRGEVDAELGPLLAGLSERQVQTLARKTGYARDPQQLVERHASAAKSRRVSLRPAPDGMSILTAYLPLREGVSVFAALTREADSRRGRGDVRGRGQVMADTLFRRITGVESPSQIPVSINLVMRDTALIGEGSGPAEVGTFGPIPSEVAARLIAETDQDAAMSMRRLYERPGSGQLVAMESKSRLFTKGQRRFVMARDQVCRTPWCGAPIRHIDHITPHREGGPTSIENAQGLCERCNQVKEAPGWSARARPDGSVVTTTPTGHEYLSERVPLIAPGVQDPDGPRMQVMYVFTRAEVELDGDWREPASAA